MNDSDLIDFGIRIAEGHKREISDGTARIIASQFHDGSTLTLSFASTGAILCDPIARGAEESTSELWHALFPDFYALPVREQRWANWLGTYLVHRKDHGPVTGWAELWGDAS